VIAARPDRSGSHKEAHLQGWLVSILLHGTVALIAILGVKQVQLTPQDEAFKWNVAMVSPTQRIPSTAPPQNQAPARSVPSTASIPSPSAQQSMPAPPFSSPQLLEQQTAPAISERTATPVVTEPPAPTPTELTTPTRSMVHTTEPTEPIRHETVAPMVAESTSNVKPVDASAGVSTESAVQTAPSVQAPTQMAGLSAVPSTAPAKRDYGWLSEAILRRVEELKRYPASARVDRAEGKVVVRAVINEDGNLGEVEIFQSSGYPTLDKAAVETMRQAAPFHLPHPLGQPRMTIKIPMSYRLDR
jgi:protein TonB